MLDASFHKLGRFEEFETQLLRVNLEHLIFERYSDLFLAASADLRARFIDRAFVHIANMFGTNAGYAFVSTHKALLKAYAAFRARRAR